MHEGGETVIIGVVFAFAIVGFILFLFFKVKNWFSDRRYIASYKREFQKQAKLKYIEKKAKSVVANKIIRPQREKEIKARKKFKENALAQLKKKRAEKAAGKSK